MASANHLSDKTVRVLSLIAEGRSYSQIVEGHPDLNYLDVFEAAAEALRLKETLTVASGRLAEIKSRYPNAYERWTEDEDQLLASLHTQGKSPEEIGRELKRQPSAIQSRLSKLGLSTNMNGAAEAIAGTNPHSPKTCARVALWKLGEGFLKACASSPGNQALPRDADESAYACLLLCHEHAKLLKPEDKKITEKCRKEARRAGTLAWLEGLAWDCCDEIIDEGYLSNGHGARVLIETLTHGNSGIRRYSMELAVMVRSALEPETISPLLLQNVADTLGSWTFSLGLAASLFSDEAEFIDRAKSYEPSSFHDQYLRRIQHFEEHGLASALYPIWKLEAKVRERIETAAFAQT